VLLSCGALRRRGGGALLCGRTLSCVACVCGWSQRDQHVATLKQMRFEHADQVDRLERRLAEETAAKEKLQRRFDEFEATTSVTTERLQHEAEALAQAHTKTERELQRSRQSYLQQTGDLRSACTATMARLAQERENERQAMKGEVHRLRRVQQSVLDQAGADALPGGEARRLLYFESMKAKALVQPDPSISWRGQLDVPKAEKSSQTEPQRARSPGARSRSASPLSERGHGSTSPGASQVGGVGTCALCNEPGSVVSGVQSTTTDVVGVRARRGR
jgi:hypothetical protein